MNNHYIPRLLLNQFATSKKVNTYDFTISDFCKKKLKNTFSDADLFDEELESAFAKKLEGPFGNLLNNRLLHGDTIKINRRENMLIRKFLMINNLRAPIVNGSWEEMVERTKSWNHPIVQLREFLLRHNPELGKIFDNITSSNKTYILDLKKAMEVDSLEELAALNGRRDISITLRNCCMACNGNNHCFLGL